MRIVSTPGCEYEVYDDYEDELLGTFAYREAAQLFVEAWMRISDEYKGEIHAWNQ